MKEKKCFYLDGFSCIQYGILCRAHKKRTDDRGKRIIYINYNLMKELGCYETPEVHRRLERLIGGDPILDL